MFGDVLSSQGEPCAKAFVALRRLLAVHESGNRAVPNHPLSAPSARPRREARSARCSTPEVCHSRSCGSSRSPNRRRARRRPEPRGPDENRRPPKYERRRLQALRRAALLDPPLTGVRRRDQAGVLHLRCSDRAHQPGGRAPTVVQVARRPDSAGDPTRPRLLRACDSRR